MRYKKVLVNIKQASFIEESASLIGCIDFCFSEQLYGFSNKKMKIIKHFGPLCNYFAYLCNINNNK